MFFYVSGKYNRPEIKLEIYRVDKSIKRKVWDIFKKYHYLDEDLHTSAEQFVGVMNGEIVCHTGVIQFPMKKGWKRVHRLVVLPDYQGIGIGTKFISAIAEHYCENGYGFNLTTTTPALVLALKRKKEWILTRYGRSKTDYIKFERYNEGKFKSKHLNAKKSNGRITYSFYYKAR